MVWLLAGCWLRSTTTCLLISPDARRPVLLRPRHPAARCLTAPPQERELLAKHGIAVIETPIALAVGDKGGQLSGVVLQDGCFIPIKWVDLQWAQGPASRPVVLAATAASCGDLRRRQQHGCPLPSPPPVPPPARHRPAHLPASPALQGPVLQHRAHAVVHAA